MNSSRKRNATWPATKNAIVVRSATGQLRKVPAKTPIAVRTIAWSQTPNSPFMKFVAEVARLRPGCTGRSPPCPRYCVGLMQRTSTLSVPSEPARSRGRDQLLVGVILADREDVADRAACRCSGLVDLDLGIHRLADPALGRPVDVERHLDGDRRRVQHRRPAGGAWRPRSACPGFSAALAFATRSSALGLALLEYRLDLRELPAVAGDARLRAPGAARPSGCAGTALQRRGRSRFGGRSTGSTMPLDRLRRQQVGRPGCGGRAWMSGIVRIGERPRTARSRPPESPLDVAPRLAGSLLLADVDPLQCGVPERVEEGQDPGDGHPGRHPGPELLGLLAKLVRLDRVVPIGLLRRPPPSVAVIAPPTVRER